MNSDRFPRYSIILKLKFILKIGEKLNEGRIKLDSIIDSDVSGFYQTMRISLGQFGLVLVSFG